MEISYLALAMNEVQLPPALQQTMIPNFEPKALQSTERCSYTLFCSSEAEGGQWNNSKIQDRCKDTENDGDEAKELFNRSFHSIIM